MKLGQNACLDKISDGFENGSYRGKLGQILKKPCVGSRGHIFSLIIIKLCQNICLDEISKELKMGHGGSKTRSLGQILEKQCARSGGHIFNPIIMKLGQNVCLH